MQSPFQRVYASAIGARRAPARIGAIADFEPRLSWFRRIFQQNLSIIRRWSLNFSAICMVFDGVFEVHN
jgi:hypothetical protein